MNNRTIVLCTALTGTLLAFAPVAVVADEDGVLNDPGFEMKLPPDEGGWDRFEISLVSEDQARSGSRSMFNGGLSRTVGYHPYFIGVVSGSFQEFPAKPGSRWRLTGYGLTVTKLQGTPAYGIVQLSFFNADGVDLGTVETAETGTKAKTSNEVNNKSAAGEWNFLDTGIATAPEGTAAVQAFTLYVDFSGSNTTQGVYFDDLSLCAVDRLDDESELCHQE